MHAKQYILVDALVLVAPDHKNHPIKLSVGMTVSYLFKPLRLIVYLIPGLRIKELPDFFQRGVRRVFNRVAVCTCGYRGERLYFLVSSASHFGMIGIEARCV